ncbi:MAG: tetratricopeptide repeat protein [Treponema sp.]|nr:tetratricopeptide repeat protein [Treponema sp.]MCL2271540.1 tetratricopeptide repeat protein [Treponema sp.]
MDIIKYFYVLLAVCVLFSACNRKPDITEQIIPETVFEAEPEAAEAQAVAVKEEKGNVQISYHSGRILPDISRISGRVSAYEINPINYENPDLDIMKQMGAQQYLILYLSGEKFFKTGDYDKAINEYTASIGTNREFTEAYISRGKAWLKKKEYSRAIDDFSQSIRLDNNRAETYNYRGFARTSAGTSAVSYNLAIDDFSRAIVLNRNYVDALINRSHAYYNTGNYEKAIEDCTSILRLEPQNAYIWNRRGSAWYHRKNDDRAISDFTEAIRLKPDYAIAFNNRGNALHSKGEYDKAIADFETAKKYYQ